LRLSCVAVVAVDVVGVLVVAAIVVGVLRLVDRWCRRWRNLWNRERCVKIT
jgi:uncharacterized membrane protein